jgi:hypothetical protein
MSSDEAVNGPGPMWSDEPSAQPADPDEAFDGGGWDADLTDALFDPTAGDPTVGNMFTAEIENVNASDWDVDTALIWGDEGGDAIVDGGSAGFDFPL